MEFIIKRSRQELSERKLESYLRYSQIIQWGRQYPVRYCERFYGIELLDHQRFVFMKSWITPRNVWCQSRGSGKALALNTTIPTPYGFTTMGEIKIGDYILDIEGNPTEVTYVSDIFLGNRCYEVEFEDGEKIVADEDHLWSVRTRSSVNAFRNPPKKHDWKCHVYDQIDDYGYLTLSTKELSKSVKVSRNDNYNEYKYRVPIPSPVSYSEKSLIVHPYLLGVWLGDGSSNCTRITCDDMDIDEMCRHIESCGSTTKIYRNKNRASAIGVDIVKKGTSNPLREALREIGVFENKHIPQDYLFSSVDQRYELLKGLMDTDGSCDKGGHCEFSQKDYDIIRSFSQLLSSLSIKHHISKRHIKCNGKLCESYRVYFVTDRQNSCFKLGRKLDRLKPNMSKKYENKSIVNIREAPSVPTRCIQVANPRQLFLCGEKFTATHNTTLLAPFVMAKSNLFPKHQSYIMSGVGSQSQECFLKIERIAKKEIASFTGLTDFFLGEIDSNSPSGDGFVHNPASFTYKLFNDSRVNSLNGAFDNNRSKRSNLNVYDESGFAPEDLFVTSMPFIAQDSNFALGGDIDLETRAIKIPNQAIFASSASDMSTYFYKNAYKEYAKRMFMGDKNYFVADVNAEIIFNATYNGKLWPVPILTRQEVDDELKKNKEKAMREYFNQFRIDGGDKMPFKQSVVKKNSEVRVPMLKNQLGGRFVLSYDPARQVDNSICIVAELINDPNMGYRLKICNAFSFVDTKTKKKKPMRYPEQIKHLKSMILDYNGAGKLDYENIEKLLIDSGSGGGGRFIADDLLPDWTDKQGRPHKGMMDKIEHEEYLKDFPNALDKVKLLSPKKYKVEAFDALVEMMNLDLISFTEEYDNKGYLMLYDDKEVEYEDEDDGSVKKTIDREMFEHKLSDEEELALVNIDLTKEELYNIYRYDAANGGCRYDLAADKANSMHDDRAYCMAMLGWYLQQLRRGQVLESSKPKKDLKTAPRCVSAVSF